MGPECLASSNSIMKFRGGPQVVDKLPLGRILGTSLHRAKNPGVHKLATPSTLHISCTKIPLPTAACSSHQALWLDHLLARTAQVRVLAASSENNSRKLSTWDSCTAPRGLRCPRLPSLGSRWVTLYLVPPLEPDHVRSSAGPLPLQRALLHRRRQ